jgi:hypothetical protein
MTDQPGAMPAREALSAPGVRPLLISSFVLTTGVMLQAAALGKHIFDITDSELDDITSRLSNLAGQLSPLN